MKKSFILALFLFEFISGFSQGCLPVGISFIRQTQIDSFQLVYPECSKIIGDVIINGNDISNLYGLSSLDSMGGNLVIRASSPQFSFSGLNNLKSITGNLQVFNDNLQNFIGLDRLHSIGGNLEPGNIHQGWPENLSSFSGLDSLESIGGELFIRLDQLQDFSGLNAVKTIGGKLEIASCPSLISDAGFDSLVSVGALEFNNCSQLSQISGFNKLVTVGGTFILTQCNLLTSITGLNSLALISGGFTINANPHLQGIDGLFTLDSVGSSLTFSNNASLQDVNGLSRLNVIGGDFTISNNLHLNSISGLHHLHSIGGDLKICQNPLMQSLIGLDSLQPASVENLQIYSNSALSDCSVSGICAYLGSPNGKVSIYHNHEGCNSPAEIADACGNALPCLPYGDYYLLRQLDIDQFPDDFPSCINLNGNVIIGGEDITNLSGLNQMLSVEGNLSIGSWEYGDNPGLHNLQGLNNLEHVGGVLTMEYDGVLEDITALQNLDSVGGLSLEYLPSLQDLSGLNNLKRINGIFQVFNPIGLESFSGLSNLDFVQGDLSIRSVPGIMNLSGLETLDSVGGSLILEYNDLLTNLEGLDSLKLIRRSLRIDNCELLENLDGIGELQTIGRGLDIADNPVLENISALNRIDTLTSLSISGNVSLSNLDGLQNLTTISGGNYIYISGNHSLLNLAELSNLHSLDNCRINIYWNLSLESLNGLENLNSGSISEFRIRSNIELSSCEVKSLCDYLLLPDAIVEISNNAPGCNTVDEVKLKCLLGTNEPLPEESAIELFPNPVDRILFIRKAENLEDADLEIMNLRGQPIIKKKLTDNASQIDLHSFSPGIYLYRIVSPSKLRTGKLIKGW